MAIRLPLYPNDLGRNNAYLWLMDEYPQSDKWHLETLYDKFAAKDVEELIDEMVVTVKRDDQVVLSFCYNGTIPHSIIRYVESEILSFPEVAGKFPRAARCSSSRLKTWLTFLSNFKKIQYFIAPCSTLTAITTDDFPDEKIDRIFCYSSDMEPKIVYQMDTDEGASELARLQAS